MTCSLHYGLSLAHNAVIQADSRSCHSSLQPKWELVHTGQARMPDCVLIPEPPHSHALYGSVLHPCSSGCDSAVEFLAINRQCS